MQLLESLGSQIANYIGHKRVNADGDRPGSHLTMSITAGDDTTELEA